MFKFAVLMAVLAVATAAPSFIGAGSYAHGAALFPGHVGYTTPALVKGHAFGAIPVAPVAYTSPAIVKSAVVAPASVAIASPAVIKTPFVGSYSYGHLGHLGHFDGHLGGYGGHFIH